MNGPDPILEAAAAAIDGSDARGCGCCAAGRTWDRDEVLAHDVLTAVRPLIEAEVRKRIAREIEAADPNYGYRLNAHDAAAIARGSDG